MVGLLLHIVCRALTQYYLFVGQSRYQWVCAIIVDVVIISQQLKTFHDHSFGGPFLHQLIVLD
jgi:hypothetical protein